MVEYTLDNIFYSLSDPTRRDILTRIAKNEMSIGEIALPYDLTFAAVSKHLKVLEHARLIVKRRKGKHQLVSLSPTALKTADDYLEYYRNFWDTRLDRLENYLSEDKE